MYNRSDSLRASMRSFLLSSFNKAFRRGSHTTKLPTCGRNRSYNQAAQVPSSNVTCKSPRSPSKNCRIVLAFVSMAHSMTIYPAAFLTAIEILSVWTYIPIYLMLLIIKGVLSGRVEPNTQNPTPKGAPFYIASCAVSVLPKITSCLSGLHNFGWSGVPNRPIALPDILDYL